MALRLALAQRVDLGRQVRQLRLARLLVLDQAGHVGPGRVARGGGGAAAALRRQRQRQLHGVAHHAALPQAHGQRRGARARHQVVQLAVARPLVRQQAGDVGAGRVARGGGGGGGAAAAGAAAAQLEQLQRQVRGVANVAVAAHVHGQARPLRARHQVRQLGVARALVLDQDGDVGPGHVGPRGGARLEAHAAGLQRQRQLAGVVQAVACAALCPQRQPARLVGRLSVAHQLVLLSVCTVLRGKQVLEVAVLQDGGVCGQLRHCCQQGAVRRHHLAARVRSGLHRAQGPHLLLALQARSVAHGEVGAPAVWRLANVVAGLEEVPGFPVRGVQRICLLPGDLAAVVAPAGPVGVPGAGHSETAGGGWGRGKVSKGEQMARLSECARIPMHRVVAKSRRRPAAGAGWAAARPAGRAAGRARPPALTVGSSGGTARAGAREGRRAKVKKLGAKERGLPAPILQGQAHGQGAACAGAGRRGATARAVDARFGLTDWW